MATVRWPKGSTSKPFAANSPRSLVGNLLLRPQFHDDRHQEPLHLHFLLLPPADVPVKQNPFVRGVLVDDPEAVGLTATIKLSCTWPRG